MKLVPFLAVVLAASPMLPAAAAVAPPPASYVKGLLEGTLRDPRPTPGPLTAGESVLQRLTAPSYVDGIGEPAPQRSPRKVLNAIDQPEHRGATPAMTNLGVTLMQLFASHEIARTPTRAGEEHAFDLEIAPDDPIAVGKSGRFVMPMQRAAHIGGASPGDPRQQLSDVSPAFDGSIVYGSTPERTALLRANDGTGRMKITPEGTPPIIDGVPTVGDVRGAENIQLLQAHTLFLRQHNTLADGVKAQCDKLGESCSGDFIHAAARRLLTAQTQKVVYDELLPAFLGDENLDAFLPDPGQVDTIRGPIINEATTAVLRVGHSQVPNTVLTIDEQGNRTEIPLADCFFNNCLAGVPLDDFLRGAAHQAGEPVDTEFADALRNSQLPAGDATFVIGLPDTTTHRAADHGLGGYLALRDALNFPDASLEDLLPPHVLDAYRDDAGNLPSDIPIFIGAVAEKPLPGAQVGPLAAAVHALQFAALRALDPDFYDTPGLFDAETLAWLYGTSLRDIILANTSIDPASLPGDLYVTPIPGALPLAATGVIVLAALRRRARGRRVE